MNNIPQEIEVELLEDYSGYLRDINQEVIDVIAGEIEENSGFDPTHAILVRPLNGGYEIARGHHRTRAARQAGIDKIWAFVRELSDDEIWWEQLIGNTQGELTPIVIGRHALALPPSERGGGAGRTGGNSEIARRLKKTRRQIKYLKNAAEVEKHGNLGSHVFNGNGLTKHLRFIHQTPQATWHTLVMWLSIPDSKGNIPTATRTEKLVKQIKKYIIPDEYKEFYPIEIIAKAYTETERPTPDAINNAVNMVRSLESIIKENSAKFAHDLFPFTLDDFHQWLRNGVGTYAWQIEKLSEYRDDVIRAAQDAYRPQPADCQPGEWHKLGEHLLYCGDTSQPEFWENLPDVPFVFADPPYNAKVGNWDKGFSWSSDGWKSYDWIGTKGKVSAVTPGIANIQSFFKNDTAMVCSWSMACWITNGQTRGAMGFGNWIYIALFSKESIHQNAQDHIKVTISTADTKDSGHRGRKPPELMEKLISLFSEVGETVIDPFLGSGTTLFEADKLGRKCIGGEISPEFCNDIINRWQKETGQAAEGMK
jgi:ParB/RepB/Spo0J family partition protein